MEETIEYGHSKSALALIGVVTLGFLGTVGFVYYLSNKKDIAEIELKKTRIERGYVIQERDLNGNGISEKFYTLDGKIAVVELDGKSLFSSLDTIVLEKKK